MLAGLRQGLDLNYECATGTCGTCRARLIHGDIDQGWEQAPGRAALKSERGEFLMCQARALTDCDIRTPGKLQRRDLGPYMPDQHSGSLVNAQLLNHDVMQFDIVLTEPMHFHAGQFVLIESSAVAGSRAYSMVNFANEVATLRFVVKRLPGGYFSDWLFEHNVENAEVNVFGPLGSAIFEPKLDKELLCIAGGSGIAGMMSIFSHACDIDYFASHQGRIFFGVRTPADLFYVNQLTAFASRYPETLKITIAFSELDENEPAPELPELIHATHGFVHVAARACELPAETTMAYVAGPPVMVDEALRDLLTSSGYSTDNIRYDKFA